MTSLSEVQNCEHKVYRSQSHAKVVERRWNLRERAEGDLEQRELDLARKRFGTNGKLRRDPEYPEIRDRLSVTSQIEQISSEMQLTLEGSNLAIWRM